MKPAGAARILLCSAGAAGAEDVRQVLDQAGLGVSPQVINGDETDDLAGCSAVILEGGRSDPAVLAYCRRLRPRAGDAFVPILFITADASPAGRLAGFEAGADACLLRPFAAGELLAQVQALVRIKDLHDRLAEKTQEVLHVNRRLQQAHQQINQELELARRLQQSFLPQRLPEVPRVRFAVQYQLCGRVGGDFYDIFRLDEAHVGFYVADAMGHGVPASLLTIFVKKGVLAKEIFGKEYRLVPPNEVLERLNRDLVDQAISETPFITMVYALFNFVDGTLQFSRAGHPHPLFLPRDGEPRLLEVHGSLLGVFDTTFQVHTERLRPGDKLLFYSDGIEPSASDGQGLDEEDLLARAARYADQPIQELVTSLTKDLLQQVERPDDVTLLGLEMCGT